MKTESRPSAESILELGRVLLQRRHLIVRPIVGLVLLVGLVTLALPRTYTAGAAFTPQSPDASLAGLTGLAAQFGVNVPQAGANDSPDFYAELIKMPSLLSTLVMREYAVPTADGPLTANLVRHLGITEPDSARAREAAVKKLARAIDVERQLRTGVVSFQVRSRWPALSRSIADSLLHLVNTFNLETRQTQAANERRFVEARLRDARSELRSAEGSMMAFLSKNRDFRGSPTLLFEHERLQREVAVREGVVSALTQSFENARLEEVRNTPVITVIQTPAIPASPDSRQLLLRLTLAALLGVALGVLGALIAEYAQDGRDSDPMSFEELRLTARASLRDLRRPWRLLSPPESTQRRP